MELITRGEVSNTATNISIAGIASNYQHLQLDIVGSIADSGYARASLKLTFNGVTTGTGYHSIFMGSELGTGRSWPGAQTSYNTSTDHIAIGGGIRMAESDFNTGAFQIYIFNYASTSYNKNVLYKGTSFAGEHNTSYTYNNVWGSGMWENTSAITSISLVTPNGTYSGGTTYALYGYGA